MEFLFVWVCACADPSPESRESLKSAEVSPEQAAIERERNELPAVTSAEAELLETSASRCCLPPEILNTGTSPSTSDTRLPGCSCTSTSDTITFLTVN
ncbi:UNVERIFIED_CONTAM: hypothetical protein FKN15_041408 [Acipenser sinensis]